MLFKIGRKLSLGGSIWWLSYLTILQISLTSAIATPIKLKLPPPPQRGIAGNRTAAASRNTCPTVAQPLTAFVPEYRATTGNRVWGLTSLERPTIWFYVPYAKTEIVNMSFTLQDESNPAEPKIIYQGSKLSPARTPGVMSIVVPTSSEPLATNKSYHWFLSINVGCGPLFVDGWVQRVEPEPNLRQTIERANPTARVALYTENGFWYDALTTLATLRISKPQDSALSQDWQNLLDAIELGSLASQPLSQNLRSDRSQQSSQTGF
jgi:Domain of Unknown Function (DUF928)